MKKFGPWKRIAELEAELDRLRDDLIREQAFHENTKIQHKKLTEDLAKSKAHTLKMAQIIALTGGILV